MDCEAMQTGIRSRANQPCLQTVFVGTLVPEIQMGRTYLRPITGTSEGPQENAFNAPRSGRTSSAVSCVEISEVSLWTAAEATRNWFWLN